MLTNKFVGIPIFAVVMFGVFYISQSTVGTWIADWLVVLKLFRAGLRFGGRSKSIPSGAFGGWHHWRRRRSSRFLPLVMVMYFLIALLEDCGYGSRYCGFRSDF